MTAKGSLGLRVVDRAVGFSESRRNRQWSFLEWSDRHLPGINQIDGIIAVLLRESNCPVERLVLSTIQVSYVAVLSSRNTRELWVGSILTRHFMWRAYG
jgi:hypothetical protein